MARHILYRGDGLSPAISDVSSWRSFIRGRDSLSAGGCDDKGPEDSEQALQDPNGVQSIFGRALEVTLSRKSFASASTVMRSRSLRNLGGGLADDNRSWRRRSLRRVHTGLGSAGYESDSRSGSESCTDDDGGDGDTEAATDTGAALVRGADNATANARPRSSAAVSGGASPLPARLSPRAAAGRGAGPGANSGVKGRVRDPESSRSCPNLILPFAVPGGYPGPTPGTSFATAARASPDPCTLPSLVQQQQQQAQAQQPSQQLEQQRFQRMASGIPFGSSSITDPGAPESPASGRAAPEWAAAALSSRPRSRLQLASIPAGPTGAAAVVAAPAATAGASAPVPASSRDKLASQQRAQPAPASPSSSGGAISVSAAAAAGGGGGVATGARDSAGPRALVSNVSERDRLQVGAAADAPSVLPSPGPAGRAPAPLPAAAGKPLHAQVASAAARRSSELPAARTPMRPGGGGGGSISGADGGGAPVRGVLRGALSFNYGPGGEFVARGRTNM